MIDKNNDCQVQKVYLSHNDTGGAAAGDRESLNFKESARLFVKRKLGQSAEAKPPTTIKRRRCKSYQMILQIHNILKGLGKSIANFYIPRGDDGNYSIADPFAWPTLSLSPDRGADMVCCDHFLAYEAQINLSTDYDPSHDGKNVGKGTLKNVGLWSHQVAPPCTIN